jgi:hypothetical protein
MVPTLPLIETLFNETCKTKNTLDHNHILSRDTSNQRRVRCQCLMPTNIFTTNDFYFLNYYQYLRISVRLSVSSLVFVHQCPGTNTTTLQIKDIFGIIHQQICLHLITSIS